MQKRNRFSTGLRVLTFLAAAVVFGAILKMILDRRRLPPPSLPTEPSGPSNASHPEPAVPVAETEDASPNGHIDLDDVTKQELYKRAKELDIQGRSKMNKEELAEAIEEHGAA